MGADNCSRRRRRRQGHHVGVLWLLCSCWWHGVGHGVADSPYAIARPQVAQPLPELHTPVRLSAEGSREVVRLLHKQNISETVLPAPQSVLITRRAGHVRRIVFEWPEPGPRGVPALPISIGPGKLDEADLAKVLHALLRRYALTCYLPDSAELLNTQVVGLVFTRATLRLRMRDEELQPSNEGGGERGGGGGGGGEGGGGGGGGGRRGGGQRTAESDFEPGTARGARGGRRSAAEPEPSASAFADANGRRTVARDSQRLLIEGLTVTVGTDLHSAQHGISARLRVTLHNVTVAFDLVSTVSPSAPAANDAPPDARGDAVTDVTDVTDVTEAVTEAETELVAEAVEGAVAEAQRAPGASGADASDADAASAAGADDGNASLPAWRATERESAPQLLSAGFAGCRVNSVWLGNAVLRAPRGAPAAAAAAAVYQFADEGAAAPAADWQEALDVEAPLRYLRRHSSVTVRALDVPLAPNAAAGVAAGGAAGAARGALDESGGDGDGDGDGGGGGNGGLRELHGLRKLSTLCRSHVVASSWLRSVVSELALSAVVNLLIPQTDAAIDAIAAQEAERDADAARARSPGAAATAAATAAAAAARGARRPRAPQPTLPTLLARAIEGALSPAAARTNLAAHLLRELVVERRAFSMPFEAEAQSELARLHGIHRPQLQIESWGGVDVALTSPHSLVVSDLYVRFTCEIKRAVSGALRFVGSIHLTAHIPRLQLAFDPRNGTILERPPVRWKVVRCEVGTNTPDASVADSAMLLAARIAVDPEAELASHVHTFLQSELYKLIEKIATDLWAFQPQGGGSAAAARRSESHALVLAADERALAGAPAADPAVAARAEAGALEADAADLVGATGTLAAEWQRWAAERTAPQRGSSASA